MSFFGLRLSRPRITGESLGPSKIFCMQWLMWGGRLMQCLMVLALIAGIVGSGADPARAGELTGRMLVLLLLSEGLIRASQPKTSKGDVPEPPSGGNCLAGGCLLLLMAAFGAGMVAGLKAGFGAPARASLSEHAGPDKMYKLSLPKGAKIKKEYRSESLPLGNIKVRGEVWESADEGGAVGVIDVPVILGSYKTYDRFGRVRMQQGGAISDAQILSTVQEYQMKSIGASVGASKSVNRLGIRGEQVDFTVGSKKLRGQILYLFSNRSIFFCLYAASQKHWDQIRADSVLSSFRCSSLH